MKKYKKEKMTTKNEKRELRTKKEEIEEAIEGGEVETENKMKKKR